MPELLVQTRLLPPRLRRPWLHRPRLLPRLQRMIEEPLTVVVAGTGYGKSTTIAGYLERERRPVAWYSLGDEDTDPLRFLGHLIAALRLIVPGIAEHLLHGPAEGWLPQIGERTIDLLCNELLTHLATDTFLVLDDYQYVDRAPTINPLVERLLAHAPPRLHLVIIARRWPPLAGLAAWRARSTLVELSQAELTFTSEEVAAFFAASGSTITAAEADILAARTEGWAITLQLLQQGLSSGAASAPSLLERTSPSLQVLFDYLAEEVLGVQPSETQDFLLQTAILRTLSPALCDAVLGTSDCAALLQRTQRDGLFLVAVGTDHYRYHQLFRDFLLQQAERQAIPFNDLHGRAAQHYQQIGHDEEAIYHYLAADAGLQAAHVLKSIAATWFSTGRAASLAAWLDRLPPPVLDADPALLEARAEAARLQSQYAEAQAWYRRAEHSYAAHADLVGQSRALRGQAQIYLDTVRPQPAEQFLKRALKLLGRNYPAESAAVLYLLAENILNRGRAGLAAKLHAAAARMSPTADPRILLHARIELRTGQIVAARSRLQTVITRQPSGSIAEYPAEAHREPLLLLSLLTVWMGEPELAQSYAAEGLRRGRVIGAPMVEATSQIRLGHSLQLLAQPHEAAAAYERAILLADEFNVARTKAEPLMGLVTLAGSQGDLSTAETYGREALAIVQRTGDEWMAALLWLALGIARVIGQHAAPTEPLAQAELRFRASADSYGLAAVHLWRALAALRLGEPAQAQPDVQSLLQLITTHGYDYLITRPTLFTPRDRQMLPPLLLLGLTLPDVAATARRLLTASFPVLSLDARPGPAAIYHPGLTLRIQTLGQFRVWRGTEEITAWSRDTARQLLQLLVTERHHWLQREQIMERLWPEVAVRAESQFKVALHALTTALEPNRLPHAPSSYIRRSGSAYRFAPAPDAAWLDVEHFELLLQRAESATTEQLALYRRALALYHGDYLAESIYDEWLWETRERLLARYLNAAITLARLLLEADQLPEAIRWCETVLDRDHCWEEAYRLLMRAYLHQGNRSQALRTYERCVRHLVTELGVAPLPETTQIYAAVHEQTEPPQR